MAILGGAQVRPNPSVREDPFEDTRTLAFRSLDGTNLIDFTGDEFFDLDGVEGLDLPPREVIRDSVPRMDGTRLREIRIGERQVFLPLFLSSQSSHLAYLTNRDELARLFNHRRVNLRETDGTFDLVARSARGERYLRCTYLDGMPGSRSTDSSGSAWEALGLTLLACRPYWYGEPWKTPIIKKPGNVAWFGTWPGQLSSSRAIGAGIPINVAGDVPSFATVDLVGPATSVTVTAPGLSVSIPAGLAAGEPAKIVTSDRGRTALFGGVKDWSRVAPTDRYEPLQPGLTEISIVMAGTTSNSLAQVSGPTLFERWS